MGSLITRFFIEVKELPNDGYGFVQLLFLGAAYGAVLFKASNWVKDGSELLLLIPSFAGIVGSVVLPFLGAVPDGAIVLFSGLGDDAQEQLSVGMGALAGSTVLLLTVPWGLSLIGGRVNLDDETGEPVYSKPPQAPSDWKKLTPGRFARTGVAPLKNVNYSAKFMLFTLLPFLIVQIPAFAQHCALTKDEDICEQSGTAALAAGIVAIIQFVLYLIDQVFLNSSSSLPVCAAHFSVVKERLGLNDSNNLFSRFVYAVSHFAFARRRRSSHAEDDD